MASALTSPGPQPPTGRWAPAARISDPCEPPLTTNEQLLQRRNAAVPRGPFHVAPIFAARAEGVRVWDVEGREYLDFCGGIGVLNVGHNHPRVVAAVQAQLNSFIHTCFHVVMYEEYVRLAERLNTLVPIEGPCKTALFNSGAEAGENAVKIARAYTKRPAVVAFERGFHGRTLLGMSLTGKVKPYSAGFGPFAPEIYRLPYEPFFHPGIATDREVEKGANAALDHLFAYHIEAESIACVIAEPVLGEGGFYPIHPVALRVLRQRCKDAGILYVSDEVQSGFGRCGAMFAIQRYGLEPDMVAMAKSLAGGMTLSAVTARAEIMDAPGPGGIGGTYGGSPLACAAANAVLDVMEEESLAERALLIGEAVMEGFHALKDHHPFITGVHGLGAMCGLEIDTPARASAICNAARERGLLIMTASGNVIRTLMPLVISVEDLEAGLDRLAASVAACR